jgi:hypothetical protein
MNKKCCTCKETKQIDDFSKNRSTGDGYSFACRSCNSKTKRESYKKNKEKILLKSKENYYKDVEKSRKLKREWAHNNKESEIKRASEWYKNNKKRKQKYDKQYILKNREKRRLASKRNREKHPDRKRADCAFRRAQKLKATPPWVDRKELRKIYSMCPKGYHVDHIIPLKGRGVSGLHVPWNLQYLRSEDNLKKYNHYSYGD